MDSTREKPRSNERPAIILTFATTVERQDFVDAMVHAMDDAAPPKGSNVLSAERAFRRILTWGVR